MKKFLLSLLSCASLQAATTHMVTNNSGSVATPNSLPYFMLNAAAGDTIDCTMIAGQTILLAASLPAINGNLNITGGTGAAVTLNGASFYQIFSVGSGNAVALQNFLIENGISKGAPGGVGYGGGGGGAGGGGGLYVHNGANVGITNIQFSTCSAVGGPGGAGNGALASGGGGGGGYNDNTTPPTTGSGTGGAGGATGGGGGGGGNTGGGVGGGGGGATGAVGANGIFFGGGGGGGGGMNGGTGGTSGTTSPFAGGAATGANGGGGAGIAAAGSMASSSTGGAGGNGIGSDNGFSGGGGGGGSIGGAGNGTGGGGGGTSVGSGGAGGLDGGGGGGGGNGASTGGKGGFGAGGGGGMTGGASLFGGGAGGSGAGSSGGGGAAMGGAIFIQNGGQLAITEGLGALTGNAISAGMPGGSASGIDVFLRSGGSLVFNNSAAPLTITNAIASDLNAGGGGTGGGITMMGSNKLTLASSNNIYTGNTFFKAGTIQISSDGALGSTNPITGLVFSGGTLQVSSSFTLNTARSVTLSGSGSFSADSGITFTIDNSTNAITGAGGLSASGAGTLSLIGTGTNSYSGGTTISGGGILETAADKYLGASNGGITFNNGTLQMNAGYTALSRGVQLSGNGTINTQNQTVTISSSISGGGNLTSQAGTGALILTGTNSFSGTATISTGTLQGSSTSLTGNIVDSAGAFLIFNQTINGIYSGQISGSGTFTKQGIGLLELTGNSSGFAGPIIVSAGELKVNGTLGGTSLVSAVGSTLSGSGTYSIGTVTCNGFLQPGGSIGQVNFIGNLTLTGTAQLDIEISPTQADLLHVSGILTEGGALVVQPDSGFYGFGDIFPIIQAGTLANSFATTSVSNSNFVLSLQTVGTTVYAHLLTIQPFLGFPASNVNTLSVANNLDALSASGSVSLGSPLAVAIDSLVGASNDAINATLDQMHPALFSGFYDLQAEVGSQIITFFHKRPSPTCSCSGRGRAWAEPFGNWLDIKNKGIEVGFNAYSKGVAAGVDWEVIDCLAVGVGGAWNHTELHWHGERGHADLDGFFGGAYLDFTGDYIYIGASFLAGRDFYNTFRKITFGNVNEDARGDYRGLDLLSQLSTAYFLGPDMCCLLPYFNLDFFYLNQNSFTEKNAPGLNLQVNNNAGATMRSELGLGLQVIDRNRNETMCISPQVAMGWTCICPLFRDTYTSTFLGQSIPFNVVGWDHTWQLLTLRFGLTLSYKCYSLSGEYLFELAPQDGTPLFDQKGNLRLDFSW
jgi:uncharacterized protein with beta-barrel porin domain